MSHEGLFLGSFFLFSWITFPAALSLLWIFKTKKQQQQQQKNKQKKPAQVAAKLSVKLYHITPNILCGLNLLRHSSFSQMKLANLPNLAKMITFYAKYFRLNSKCSEHRFKAFYNEIK